MWFRGLIGLAGGCTPLGAGVTGSESCPVSRSLSLPWAREWRCHLSVSCPCWVPFVCACAVERQEPPSSFLLSQVESLVDGLSSRRGTFHVISDQSGCHSLLISLTQLLLHLKRLLWPPASQGSLLLSGVHFVFPSAPLAFPVHTGGGVVSNKHITDSALRCLEISPTQKISPFPFDLALASS